MGGAITATNKLRVATIDTAHAMDVACSDVEAAVGLPVRAEFQEIEGGHLIIELQLGSEAGPHSSPFTTGLGCRQRCRQRASPQFLEGIGFPRADSSALPPRDGGGLRTLASSCSPGFRR